MSDMPKIRLKTSFLLNKKNIFFFVLEAVFDRYMTQHKHTKTFLADV